MQTPTRYDVALSFAGEDRAYARELATALRSIGVSVFFDDDARSELWGEDLYAYLADLYRNRARYVVMFLSQHYARKTWTTHERRAAQARALTEGSAYILPIRLDDTPVDGILPTLAYELWPQGGPGKLVALVLQKLGRRVNSVDGTELIFVPAGPFIMGSDGSDADHAPARAVSVGSYHIGKDPVTVAQFRVFAEATDSEMPPSFGFRWKDEHPIVNVTWHEAAAYSAWAGGRLPTEAEWEKAARGTDGRTFPWGNGWDSEACRWDRRQYDSAGTPVLVGSHPQGASPFGVSDMVGNVWEWCSDWYDAGYYRTAPLVDPVGPDDGRERVARGCGWCDDIRRFPMNFSCYSRSHKEPGFRYVLWGFRYVV